MQQKKIKMQQLRKQNQKMQKIIEGYLEEIQKHKEINQHRQSQIESLLKFNERLLFIVENQIAHNRRDSGSLVPISQKSERQSDLMNPMNSLIKTKNTFVARSQKGSKSVIQKNTYLHRLQALGKNLQNSQFIRSQDIQDSFLYSVTNKSHYKPNPIIQNQKIYSDMTNKIQKRIFNQMQYFYNSAQRNKQFYNEKINELKNLSNKVGIYKPEQKFVEISKKVQMSAGTANLVKKAMMSR